MTWFEPRISLVSEVAALPTEPQPQPRELLACHSFDLNNFCESILFALYKIIFYKKIICSQQIND